MRREDTFSSLDLRKPKRLQLVAGCFSVFFFFWWSMPSMCVLHDLQFQVHHHKWRWVYVLFLCLEVFWLLSYQKTLPDLNFPQTNSIHPTSKSTAWERACRKACRWDPPQLRCAALHPNLDPSVENRSIYCIQAANSRTCHPVKWQFLLGWMVGKYLRH